MKNKSKHNSGNGWEIFLKRDNLLYKDGGSSQIYFSFNAYHNS